MAGKRPVVYWDTNVYIDWLKESRTGTPQGEGIAFWYDLIVAREAVLIYSQVLWLEVSALNVGPVAFSKFERFVMGFGTSWPIDRPVINEAGRLREQSVGMRKSGTDDTVICVPDAIHLATANLAGCASFFTFDREGRHGCFGLLPFDKRLAGFSPRIMQPAVDPNARPRRHVPSLAEVMEEHPSLFGKGENEHDAGEITVAATGAEAEEAQGGLALGGSDGEGDTDAPAAEGTDGAEGADGAEALPPGPEAAVAAEGGNGRTPDPSAGPLVESNAEPPPLAPEPESERPARGV